MRGVLVVLFLLSGCHKKTFDPDDAVRTKRNSGVKDAAVIAAPAPAAVMVPDVMSGFTPQVRLGYTSGDQWEPAIAADRSGHVYLLYPQYLGVPGCPSCPSPTMILQVSADHGASWGAPRQIAAPGTGQWDAQIVVDPVDGRTVYAAWLQNNKSDVMVARSYDFGATWILVVADRVNAGLDKPILLVRGRDVYVASDHAQKIFVSRSHDGGATFATTAANANGKLGLSLAGGGAIDPAGNVYFAWSGYEGNGGAKGAVNLYISRSTDGGVSWSPTLLDVSRAGVPCPEYYCGWAFLGAQITMTADDAGTLYALWNANRVDYDVTRVYFSRSSDRGATWSPAVDVSLAPAGANHAFPAVVAGAAADVRIAWMDARAGLDWNVYYRSSSDGGASFSGESDLSTPVAGYPYIDAGGFAFPFGDYFELAIDERGTTHAIWGEGLNYDTPGSVWYSHGR